MSDAADHFEDKPGYACYRPQGRTTNDRAIDQVVEAVKHAGVCGFDKLFVDLTLLSGFDILSFWQRVRLAVQAAEVAQFGMVVAVLATEEMIDYEKIAVQMARNRGLLCDVFTCEQDALTWLSNPS